MRACPQQYQARPFVAVIAAHTSSIQQLIYYRLGTLYESLPHSAAAAILGMNGSSHKQGEKEAVRVVQLGICSRLHLQSLVGIQVVWRVTFFICLQLSPCQRNCLWQKIRFAGQTITTASVKLT